MNLPGGSVVLVLGKTEIPPFKGFVYKLPPSVTCDVSVTVSSDGKIMGLASKRITIFPAQTLQCEIESATGPVLNNVNP